MIRDLLNRATVVLQFFKVPAFLDRMITFAMTAKTPVTHDEHLRAFPSRICLDHWLLHSSVKSRQSNDPSHFFVTGM